jgi:hypothetical protein
MVLNLIQRGAIVLFFLVLQQLKSCLFSASTMCFVIFRRMLFLKEINGQMKEIWTCPIGKFRME